MDIVTEDLAAAQSKALKTYPIDLAYLREHTLGNSVLEQDMLALYVRQSGRMIHEFSDTASGQDWRFYARAFKGSALNVGALDVARLAERLENAELAKGMGAARDILPELKSAVLGTNELIRNYLQNGFPAKV